MTPPRTPARTTTAAGTDRVAARHDLGGFDVVTGAFSYSGRAIADALSASGRAVRTLTGHPERGRGSTIEARPLDFDDPRALREAMEGATTLYNTYWVRFAHGRVDHDFAVASSRALFRAAREAGVQRIVHVSITHPSPSSPYPYFRGKAQVEQALNESGVPHGIVRPAILFGGDGVLVNNIAWLLRRFPVFAIGGRGDYRVRPIHVDDLARLCVDLGRERTDTILDAVGPERPTFAELVGTLRAAVGSRSVVVHVPGALLPPIATVLGRLLGDVLLSADEYRAMADGLADTGGPATGTVRLSEWIAEHAQSLGRTYAHEIRRHFR